ncbi:hypothetical protein [Pseudomonas sichuanensis]|uniref:hypothetical protein n=1 Tax=Pseudomonas TaxID=286 RepID=UPI0036E3BCB7
MKHYVISQKKDAGSQLGLLDAALFDKAYETWDEVRYGYFPWYANSTRKRPHEKMPAGMVLVGKSKKYYFGARRLARGLYAINGKFYLACLEAGVKFVDVEKVNFIIDGGAENPVSYYAAVFESYPCDEVIESASNMTCDEYGSVESFERFKLRSPDSAVFRIGGLSPYIDTLYCTEDFKIIAERHGVLGVEFISLDGSDSRGIYPL